MLMATPSPSNMACVASERQCRPAMLRACAILLASLFRLPVSVIWPGSGPVYDKRDKPSGLGTTGLGNTTLSVLKNAFKIVTQAPAVFPLLLHCLAIHRQCERSIRSDRKHAKIRPYPY